VRIVQRLGRYVPARRNDSRRSRHEPDIGETCRDWRQGDVFEDGKAFVFDWKWRPHGILDIHGAAVVSQTCDASLPSRERIQIAPVVRIDDPDDLHEAAAGKRTQFVALPRIGPNMFVDLDGLTTVGKAALLGSRRTPGVKTDQEIREFAFSVARRFGRFAYPDEVNDCLKPVTKVLKSKARNEATPLGKVLTKVHSFRIRCDDWATTPHDLTIVVILEPDVVPLDLEDLPEPAALTGALAVVKPPTLGAKIAKCIERLNQEQITPAERYFAWQYLVDYWAQQCQQEAKARGLTGVVGCVTAELTSTDDFRLSDFLVTESLDLDYLSDSRKPIT